MKTTTSVASPNARNNEDRSTSSTDVRPNQPNTGPRRQFFECWGCGDRRHQLRNCPNTSNEGKKRILRGNGGTSPSVRPIQDKPAGTCISVFSKKRRIKALVDTGSDITVAGTEVAKRCRWRIRPCELDSITVANGENRVIDGIVTENLSVGNRSVASRIHVSSDMSGLILGVDWLQSRGRTI